MADQGVIQISLNDPDPEVNSLSYPRQDAAARPLGLLKVVATSADALSCKGRALDTLRRSDPKHRLASLDPTGAFILRFDEINRGKLCWTLGLTAHDQITTEELDIVLGTYDGSSLDYDENPLPLCVKLFTVSFHKSSGIPLFTANTTGGVSFVVNDEWLDVPFQQTRAIFRPGHNTLNHLEFAVDPLPGRMNYDIFFALDGWTEASLRAERENLFGPLLAPFIEEQQTFVPSPYLLKTGDLLLGGPVHAEGRDRVYRGVKILNGDPVLVVEKLVWNREERDDAMCDDYWWERSDEIPCVEYGKETVCSHWDEDCPQSEDRVYLIRQYHLGTYDDFSFNRLPDPKYRISCDELILIGLNNLHKRRVLHRDVRPGLMVVRSVSPIKAALEVNPDTLIWEGYNDEASMGVIHGQAPEVTDGEYTTASDLWSWGYSMAQSRGYKPSSEKAITSTRIAELRGWVHNYGKANGDDALLAQLLLSVLEEKPGKRPTVEVALNHACWKDGIGKDHRPKDEDLQAFREAYPGEDYLQPNRSTTAKRAQLTPSTSDVANFFRVNEKEKRKEHDVAAANRAAKKMKIVEELGDLKKKVEKKEKELMDLKRGSKKKRQNPEMEL